jgi:hypothetical protein
MFTTDYTSFDLFMAKGAASHHMQLSTTGQSFRTLNRLQMKGNQTTNTSCT